MRNPAYYLDDPRPTQKQAPYTFFLPDPRRLEALEPGDHAKLIFVPTTEGTKYGAERMWVHIIEKEGTIYRGKLDNIPDDVPGLSLGDIVKFEAWHIIDAKFHDKQKEKSLKFPRRTFYERCLVDKCVLDDGTKVHFIYRENADLTDDGDKNPDSGWRIRGDWRGLSDEEVDARQCEYVALGAVLNRDDSWVRLIDKPEGAAYTRDWENDTFVPDGE